MNRIQSARFTAKTLDAPRNEIAIQSCARRSGPDFEVLVDILWNLRQPLDQAGETILTSEEATAIRACGIEARKGRWCCPPLPSSIVGPNWKLSHLADDIEPAMRPVPWREKRAAIRSIASIDPLTKSERRLIRLLQKATGNCLDRRTLKRALWRHGARYVDFTIDRLLTTDYITEYAGLLYPLSRDSLQALIEARSKAQSRRPILVSTVD